MVNRNQTVLVYQGQILFTFGPTTKYCQIPYSLTIFVLLNLIGAKFIHFNLISQYIISKLKINISKYDYT